MARFRTLDDLDVRGKRVLVRADLNVPLKDGVVTDATPDRAAGADDRGADRARRQGRRDVAFRPSKGRTRPGSFSAAADGTAGEGDRRPRRVRLPPTASARRRSGWSRRSAPAKWHSSKILRFHKGEEANSPEFARALAELGDLYVDDAFSAAHRAHASIAALAHLLPAAAGKLMEAELRALTAALETPCGR